MINRPRQFPWVQALRAIAALSVAFLHVSNDAVTGGRDPSGLIETVRRAMPWAGGGNIFFVISGFIMIHASARLFGQPGGWATFLWRRLRRIVPLYWVATTIFLAVLLLQRSAIRGEIGGSAYVLASYAFLPWERPDGLTVPVLSLGWSLNYEMFFYLVLTPFLRLPRGRAVLGSAAGLCCLVLAGRYMIPPSGPLSFWSDPIILEFVIGMALALAVAGRSVPAWARLIMAGTAGVYLHMAAIGSFPSDSISMAVPGALLVGAAVAGPAAERTSRLTRIMVRLGDASYAMYLFHPFVMRGVTVIAAHLGVRSEAGGIWTVALSLGIAQVCALCINAGFERNLARYGAAVDWTVWRRRWAIGGIPAPTAVKRMR